jgi:hypothetical protein
LVGTPLDPRNVTRKFKALLTAAKLPNMRLHDLRHYVVFPTMSGEVGGIAGSAVNCRSHRVVARSISRHSFPDTTDC